MSQIPTGYDQVVLICVVSIFARLHRSINTDYIHTSDRRMHVLHGRTVILYIFINANVYHITVIGTISLI